MKRLFILLICGVILKLSACELCPPEMVLDACSNCHAVPDPSLLSASTWEHQVLPAMARYYVWDTLSRFKYANVPFYNKSGQLPMTDTKWSEIISYFVSKSRSYKCENLLDRDLAQQDFFDEVPIRTKEFSSITALGFACQGRCFIGTNRGAYLIDTGYQIQAILAIDEKHISHFHAESDSSMMYLDMGLKVPHNEPLGSLHRWNYGDTHTLQLLDSLRRPVHMEVDDGTCWIAEFGADLGMLSVLRDGLRESWIPGPGTIKVLSTSIGLISLQTQAVERVLSIQWPSDKPRIKTLLQFDPAFGGSDLEEGDLNGDGVRELVIASGDNADFSMEAKCYHGIYVYDRSLGSYRKTYHFPFFGCSQIELMDFDHDGRLDVIGSSYFPESGQSGLVLLRNQSDGDQFDFRPFKVWAGGEARWLVMAQGDVNGDGLTDVILGSANDGPSKVPSDVAALWRSIDLLILEGKQQSQFNE